MCIIPSAFHVLRDSFTSEPEELRHKKAVSPKKDYRSSLPVAPRGRIHAVASGGFRYRKAGRLSPSAQPFSDRARLRERIVA
jgi:hypothetical protein